MNDAEIDGAVDVLRSPDSTDGQRANAARVLQAKGYAVAVPIVAPIANEIEDPTEDDAALALADLLGLAEDVLRRNGDRILRPSQVRVLITMLLDSKRGANLTVARMREHGEGVGGVGAGIAYNEGSAAAYSYTLSIVAGLLGVAVGELDGIADRTPASADLFDPKLVVTDVDALMRGEHS